MKILTIEDCAQVAEILKRRANEIAGYVDQHRSGMPGSVEMALTREMARLRDLRDKIEPPKPEPENEDEDSPLSQRT